MGCLCGILGCDKLFQLLVPPMISYGQQFKLMKNELNQQSELHENARKQLLPQKDRTIEGLPTQVVIPQPIQS